MMANYYYDLHMHSCLSPCGDNEMTPANIAGMAQLKELDLIALTDHNSCRNCPALMENAAGSGLLVIPGMEINTEEEIHAVCLFRNLDGAMEFDRYVYERLPAFSNDPAIYGRQLVMDPNEKVLTEVPKLLISGCTVSLMDLKALVAEYSGICFPAHIDKSSYSVLSVLGTIPPECDFHTVEISRPPLIDNLLAEHTEIKPETQVLTNSDAHYLWDISERYHSVELEEKSIDCLFDKLR